MIFKMFRHPIDTYQDIKRYQKSSYLAAFILYGLFIVVMISSDYLTAFIFNQNHLETYNVFKEALLLMVIVLLFVVGNYLISSLQSGEGFFKDIFIATAYALAPIIILTPFLVVMSHGLTYNEIFIYNAFRGIIFTWSIILILVMVKEIHNYSLKDFIINIALTIFAALMIVLVVVLIYILANQLIDYVGGIIKEVILRG